MKGDRVFIVIWFLLTGVAFGAKMTTDEMVAGLEKNLEVRAQTYDGSRPVNGGVLIGDQRVPGLVYLRFLMEAEDLLRSLRENSEEKEKQVAVESLSSGDRKWILVMREKALVERVEMFVNPPKRGPKKKEQQKLHKAYLSKLKRPRVDAERAQKMLDRLLDQQDVDERKVKEVEEKLGKAEKLMEEMNVAFYGTSLSGEGLERVFEAKFAGKAEDLLEKVIQVRDGVLADLRRTEADVAANEGAQKEDAADGKKKATIAGVQVNSENLGVLLDHSTSMTEFLEPIRKEIDKSYPEAHFRECYGCALTWDLSREKLGKRERVMLFMEDLIVVKKVDGLYWFSDLRDEVTAEALRRLSWLRQRGKTSLYVLSVEKSPSDELMEQVESFAIYEAK